MDRDRLAETSDSASFDIYYPAGTHFQSLAGMSYRNDALVQADCSLKLSLQLAVIPEIVLS